MANTAEFAPESTWVCKPVPKINLNLSVSLSLSLSTHAHAMYTHIHILYSLFPKESWLTWNFLLWLWWTHERRGRGTDRKEKGLNWLEYKSVVEHLPNMHEAYYIKSLNKRWPEREVTEFRSWKSFCLWPSSSGFVSHTSLLTPNPYSLCLPVFRFWMLGLRAKNRIKKQAIIWPYSKELV
jgi:hypothetical protein